MLLQLAVAVVEHIQAVQEQEMARQEALVAVVVPMIQV
jgi:hypothetical protein